MSLKDQISEVVREIANKLKNDDRILSVIWFGKSYWGNAEETGDIDIAVIVKEGSKIRKEEVYNLIEDETKKKIENLGKKLDIALLYPWHIKKISDIAVFGMINDGCDIVYDRDGKVTNIINMLKNIINNMNFKVITAGLKINGKPLRIPIYNNLM